MTNHPRFFIGVPHGGSALIPHMMSYVTLVMYEMNKKGDPENEPDPRLVNHVGCFKEAGGCYVGMNRSVLSCKAVESIEQSGTTHLLMIDTDIAFDYNILDWFSGFFLNFPEAHIIAGRVNLANGYPVFYNDEHGGTVHQIQPFTGLREFSKVGTGIIAISVKCLQDVLASFGAPIFNHLIIDDREHGDDFSFCIRARELGYKTFGAWAIKGTHYKTLPCPQNYPETIEQLAPAFKKK